MRQIIRLTASTEDVNGSPAESGTFVITDPNYFQAGVESFTIPLGCKAKLWGYTLSGDPFEAEMSISHGGGAPYVPIATWVLAEKGVVTHSFKGRPEVFLDSRTGDEAFKVEWSGASQESTSRIVLLVEISDEV